MQFQALSGLLQLLERSGQVGRHLFDRQGIPNAGHDILALCVDQELPEQLSLTGSRVAGKRDTRSTGRTTIAVHHGLHVHARTKVVRDFVRLAVGDRARCAPAFEHGADCPPQLILWGLRERRRSVALDQLLVARHEVPEPIRRDFVVRLRSGRLPRLCQDRFERGVFHSEHHVAVHLKEPAVTVPREALVARGPGQPFDARVVQTEIQDGVHHAGHGDGGSRTHGHEQRVGRSAELFAGHLLEPRKCSVDLAARALGKLVTDQVVPAGLGRERESGRNRYAQTCHLSEIRTFATEEFLHFPAAVGMASAEKIDVLHWGAPVQAGRGSGGLNGPVLPPRARARDR